jgi:hypothetical protein
MDTYRFPMGGESAASTINGQSTLCITSPRPWPLQQ